jgi:hypothetical protein
VEPFRQFRAWARTARSAERVTTALAGLVVLGLLAWALVPGKGPGGSAVSAAGGRTTAGASSPGGGPAGASGAGSAPGGGEGTAAGGGAGGLTGGGSAGGSAAGGGSGGPGGTAPVAAGATGSVGGAGCQSPPGSDVGITAKQIHIGITEVNLEGPIGNQLFSIRPDQNQIIAAVIAAINKSGGVACRQLTATIYKLNPLDSSTQHAACLQMAQDGDYAVIDGGAFYPAFSRDCVPQAHIPLISGQALLESEAKTYAPYMMDVYPLMGAMMANWISAAKQRGWFSAAQGYRKGALIEDACTPEVNADAEAALARAGIPPDSMVKTVYDCTPTGGSAPPSQIQQSVLQDKVAGVTNVVWATSQTNLDLYTSTAEQQNFQPHYTMSDYDSIIGHEGPVNPLNFNGALGITNDGTGEINSGIPFNAASQKCNQVMTSHGVAPMAKEPDDDAVGTACGTIWLFVAAVDHAPSLKRADLLAGLDQVGRFQQPFPYADGLYDRAGKATGGDFWRADQWQSGCRCWRVLDRDFSPNLT